VRDREIHYGVEQWIVDKNDIYAGCHALKMAIEYVQSIECSIAPLKAKLDGDLDTMRRSLDRLTNCKKGDCP